jgi:hypothetical protein
MNPSGDYNFKGYGICPGVGHVNLDGSAGCGGGEHPLHDNNQFGNYFSY